MKRWWCVILAIVLVLGLFADVEAGKKKNRKCNPDWRYHKMGKIMNTEDRFEWWDGVVGGAINFLIYDKRGRLVGDYGIFGAANIFTFDMFSGCRVAPSLVTALGRDKDNNSLYGFQIDGVGDPYYCIYNTITETLNVTATNMGIHAPFNIHYNKSLDAVFTIDQDGFSYFTLNKRAKADGVIQASKAIYQNEIAQTYPFTIPESNGQYSDLRTSLRSDGEYLWVLHSFDEDLGGGSYNLYSNLYKIDPTDLSVLAYWSNYPVNTDALSLPRQILAMEMGNKNLVCVGISGNDDADGFNLWSWVIDENNVSSNENLLVNIQNLNLMFHPDCLAISHGGTVGVNIKKYTNPNHSHLIYEFDPISGEVFQSAESDTEPTYYGIPIMIFAKGLFFFTYNQGNIGMFPYSIL